MSSNLGNNLTFFVSRMLQDMCLQKQYSAGKYRIIMCLIACSLRVSSHDSCCIHVVAQSSKEVWSTIAHLCLGPEHRNDLSSVDSGDTIYVPTDTEGIPSHTTSRISFSIRALVVTWRIIAYKFASLMGFVSSEGVGDNTFMTLHSILALHTLAQ